MGNGEQLLINLIQLLREASMMLDNGEQLLINLIQLLREASMMSCL